MLGGLGVKEQKLLFKVGVVRLWLFSVLGPCRSARSGVPFHAEVISPGSFCFLLCSLRSTFTRNKLVFQLMVTVRLLTSPPYPA